MAHIRYGRYRYFCKAYYAQLDLSLRNLLEGLVEMYLHDLEAKAREFARRQDPLLEVAKSARDKVRELHEIFKECQRY